MAAVRGLRERGCVLVAGLLLSVGVVVGCTTLRVGEDTEDSEPETRTHVYHVQLQMTDEKEAAAQVLGRAEAWWEKQPSSDRPPLVRGVPSSEKVVSIHWKPPLYRVRLGPFATRQQAEAVLRDARLTFPDAFVAPDRIDSP